MQWSCQQRNNLEIKNHRGVTWWLSGKESAFQFRRCNFDPWVRKIPWRRKWQPTPVLLPRKCHGWRSLVGYSPRGHKELDTTERLHFTSLHTFLLLLLLLLLSRFSRVRLCVTPQMAAHQAPPSLGFSRQEHWSGLPFPSPMHESEK